MEKLPSQNEGEIKISEVQEAKRSQVGPKLLKAVVLAGLMHGVPIEGQDTIQPERNSGSMLQPLTEAARPLVDIVIDGKKNSAICRRS